MYQFNTETQGLNTYRICTIQTKEEMDTVGIGMLLNNTMKGIVPMSQMYVDNTCVLKYNISSKVSLKQFFIGKIKKDRVLKIFLSLMESIQTAENYMLEMDLLLLQKEEIYVNVATSEAELVYFPVLAEKKKADLPLFLKSILFETEFDQSENCDYVTSLINFLNKEGGFSIIEFKKLLHNLLKKEVGQQPKVEIKAKQTIPVSMPAQVIKEPEPVKIQVAYKPDENSIKQKEKKKLFSFGKKENIKKEKVKKNTAKQAFVPNLEIPGMNKADFPGKSVAKAESVKEPLKNREEIKTQTPRPVLNFGETTVLHAAQAGETTVLGADEQTILQEANHSYLIVKKTGEKIDITKNVFRIGKEKNYVDYCIMDNSAVSRSHADIISKEEGYFILDNNSLNHTYVNGEQIPSQTLVPISENCSIQLANEEFEFRLK